jgi:hypothetical protein
MDERLAQPIRVIAEHLAEWEHLGPAHVELAIFGSDGAGVIAEELDRFCREELRGAVRRGLFAQSSVGFVMGIEVGEGRRVVVKGHQPERTYGFLWEMVGLQMHLASRGLWAPTVVAGPAPLGRGLGVAEAFVDAGALADGHDTAIRRALARSLWQMVEVLRPLARSSALPRHLLSEPLAGALWPTPHSRLFDLAATAAGAEWIDEVAAAARGQWIEAGDVVIGHGDWRVEHVRFDGERPVAAFDWDSLCREREPALVGFTACAFTADWTRTGNMAPAPALAEARAFVADYEAARGRAFAADERRLCAAMFAYACAYVARCSFCSVDERARPGTFQALVAHEGLRLLEL